MFYCFGLTQSKPLAICWQMDRPMDMVNSEFTFVLILTMVRSAWTPNAYHKFPDAFSSCVFFQFAFNNFQCVITLFLIAPYICSSEYCTWTMILLVYKSIREQLSQFALYPDESVIASQDGMRFIYNHDKISLLYNVKWTFFFKNMDVFVNQNFK